MLSDSLPGVILTVSVAGLQAELQQWHAAWPGAATLTVEGAVLSCYSTHADVVTVSPAMQVVASDGEAASFTLFPVFQRNNSAPLWVSVSVGCTAALVTSDPTVMASLQEGEGTGASLSLVFARVEAVAAIHFRRTRWPFFSAVYLVSTVAVEEANGNNGSSSGGADGSSGSSVGGVQRRQLHGRTRASTYTGAPPDWEGRAPLLPTSTSALIVAPTATVQQQWGRVLLSSNTSSNGSDNSSSASVVDGNPFSLAAEQQGGSPSSPSQPLEVLLAGSSIITIVGDTTMWLDTGPQFDAGTTVAIGSLPCSILNVSADGSSITVLTPSYPTVCGNASECVSLPLIVTNVGGGVVSCPPFCPGQGVSLPVPLLFLTAAAPSASPSTTPVDGNGSTTSNGSAGNTTNATTSAAASTTASVLIVPASLSSSGGGGGGGGAGEGSGSNVGSSGSTAAPAEAVSGRSVDGSTVGVDSAGTGTGGGGGGVRYVDPCAGFTDPTTGACGNASDPRSRNCAFGSGAECVACPAGALCPGGARAWPLPGFWTQNEGSGVILPCPFPAIERCTQWDGASKSVTCGNIYAPNSVVCGACASGYYAATDGSCEACPSAKDAWTVIAPGLTFFAYLIAGSLLLVGAAVLLVHCKQRRQQQRSGGTDASAGKLQLQQIAYRVASLMSWLFIVLQVQSQVANAAGPGLPPFLRQLYTRINLFSFSGLGTPPACLGPNGPLISLSAELAVASALYCSLLGLLLVDACDAAGLCGWWRRRRRVVAVHPLGGGSGGSGNVLNVRGGASITTSRNSSSFEGNNGNVDCGRGSADINLASSSTGRGDPGGTTYPSPQNIRGGDGDGGGKTGRSGSSTSILTALRRQPRAVMIGVLITLLCLLYVTFTTAAVTLLSCTHSVVTVSQYRSMLQDGTALRALGVPLSPPPPLQVRGRE